MKSFQVKILKESFVQRISQGRSCNANESLLMHKAFSIAPPQNGSRQISARVHASNRKPSVDNSFWQTIHYQCLTLAVGRCVFCRVFFRFTGVPNMAARPNKNVTLQQICSALVNREELEYHLPDDQTWYVANTKSRFDDAEII